MARIDYTEMGQSGLVAYNGLVSESYTSKLEWPSAYAIYDEMRRRDPTIRTMWNALILLARTATWYFEPAGDTDEDKETAEYLQGCIEDMSHPIEDYIEDALTCVLFGWSWLELVYKRREDGLVGWQKWAMRRQSAFERWQFDATGGIQGMVQRPAPDYEEIPIPIDKSLHFTSQRDGGNPEGLAILETAYEPWYYLKNLQIIQGIGWQRTFVGLPVFEFTTKPSTEDTTAVETVGKALTVDAKQYVSVPESVKFRLESAQNSGAESLLNTIKYYRLLILQMLLADFINLGVGTTGSWALGSDKSQLFLMAVDGFLDRHATVVNRFGVPRLLEALPPYGEPTYNQGKAHLVHTPVEKPALAQLGSWLQQVSSLLHWSEEDENWIRKRTGMPPLVRGQGDEETGGDEEEDGLAGLAELAEEGEGARAEIEAGLLAEVRRFLRQQLARIREAIAQGRQNLGEDDGFWTAEEEAFRSTFLNRLTMAVMELVGMAVDDVTVSVGGGADWATVKADAAAWARSYVGELITRVTETTRGAVREAVASWVETGAKLPDLVKVLEPTFGKRRAELISATEVTRAFDEANDRVRQRIGLPAAEKKAPAHPGCRCATRPVLLQNGDWVIVWYTVRGDRVCRQPLETPWGRVNGCKDLHGMIVSENYGGKYLSDVRAGLK